MTKHVGYNSYLTDQAATKSFLRSSTLATLPRYNCHHFQAGRTRSALVKCKAGRASGLTCRIHMYVCRQLKGALYNATLLLRLIQQVMYDSYKVLVPSHRSQA